MTKRCIVATTNEGKSKELALLFEGFPFEISSIKGIGFDIPPPEETENTFIGNAILKAQYYAKETGCLTIADDAGLCIDALDGWPGVISARVADTSEQRIQAVLEKMKDIPPEKRQASFEVALACVDPKNNSVHVATGKTKGTILLKPQGTQGFGYDPIFQPLTVKKTYAEMTIEEKNSHSHRGYAMKGMKQYIKHVYGGKQFVVPLGIVVRDGKILINKRNDPVNPELHELWEFPGGGVEMGETVEESLLREVREETGYTTEIVVQLPHIHTGNIDKPRSTHFAIQFYLIPYICRITGGQGIINDEEVLETVWVTPEEMNNYDLIDKNKELYERLYPDLIRVIQEQAL